MKTKTKKHSFQFEVVLSVSDYWEDKESGNNEVAFMDCKEDFKTAKYTADDELRDSGVSSDIRSRVKMAVKFVEFDSGNPSHAGGIFCITVVGSKKDMEVIDELHTKWME